MPGQGGESGLGGALAVGGGQQELLPPHARGNSDDLVLLGAFVQPHREGALGAQRGDAASDVAGERLHLLERDHLEFLGARGLGELFEAQLGVAGDDGEDDLPGAGAGGESLEDLGRVEFDAATIPTMFPPFPWRPILMILGGLIVFWALLGVAVFLRRLRSRQDPPPTDL